MTETISILLPWPEYTLWPNSRSHWAVLAKARKQAKDVAFWTMKEQKLAFPLDAHIHLEYMPPTTRPYDMDNAMSSCKAYIDGMALASGADDANWHISHKKGNVRKPDGAVLVQLIVSETQAGLTPPTRQSGVVSR